MKMIIGKLCSNPLWRPHSWWILWSEQPDGSMSEMTGNATLHHHWSNNEGKLEGDTRANQSNSSEASSSFAPEGHFKAKVCATTQYTDRFIVSDTNNRHFGFLDEPNCMQVMSRSPYVQCDHVVKSINTNNKIKHKAVVIQDKLAHATTVLVTRHSVNFIHDHRLQRPSGTARKWQDP